MKTMICLVRVRRHFVPVTFYPIFSPETFFRSNILSQLLHGDILSHFWRATSRPYLGNSFAIILPYIGHISVISRLYLGYISAIPWPHLGQILSISWAYLEHISWAYLSHILSISFHDILYWAVLQGWTMKLFFTGRGGAEYLVVLGQYGALLLGTWWYWVSIGRYCLVLGGTGSVEGGTRLV